MKKIIYSISLGEELITQVLVHVSDEIAERIEKQEEVRLRISIIPDKDVYDK